MTALALAMVLAAAPIVPADPRDAPALERGAEGGDVSTAWAPPDAPGSAFGAKVGSLYAFRRVGAHGDAAAAGAGVFWLVDLRSLLAEVSVDLYSGDDNHVFSGGVGAFYPIVRGDFTPYMGGSVRYALATYGGQGANGFQVVPALGVLYAKLSAVRLRGELGWFVNLFRERLGEVAARTTGGASAQSVVTQGPIATFGIGF